MPFKRRKSGYGKSASREKFRHLSSWVFMASSSPGCNLTAGDTAREVTSFQRRLIHFLFKLWRLPAVTHSVDVPILKLSFFMSAVHILYYSARSSGQFLNTINIVYLGGFCTFSFLDLSTEKKQLPVLF